jgi:hypothetical protein
MCCGLSWQQPSAALRQFMYNQAERDLQLAKVKRRDRSVIRPNTGYLRTEQGTVVRARLRATISMCRRQGRNVFARLRDPFACQPVLSAYRRIGSYLF